MNLIKKLYLKFKPRTVYIIKITLTNTNYEDTIKKYLSTYCDKLLPICFSYCYPNITLIYSACIHVETKKLIHELMNIDSVTKVSIKPKP